MGLKIGGHVEKVNGKELNYAGFVERYLVKNQPVILTGLMDDWRACKDWVFPDGKPNLHFFSTHFGNSRVQITDCNTREFTDQNRFDMSVLDFIDHWLNLSNKDTESPSTDKCKENSLLYLKDWHLVKEYSQYVAYQTPLFFCDDWLNMYLDKYHMHYDSEIYQEKHEISCSDYRFVYMGAKGTWTPLHADVFRSYSWSGNVCGKKKWYFLSPNQHRLVFDRYMKNCVYDIFNVSENKFPGFEEAIWLECTQQTNEIIFVPSGWYHQVHNLDDTVSINHNWFNAYNLSWVLDLLLRDYYEAREYIEDIKDICDDFEGVCQRNLAANTGMNFYDFFIFLARFSFANLALLCDFTSDCNKSTWAASEITRQLVLNLETARNIAVKMNSIDFRGNRVSDINFKETLTDPTFLSFCRVLRNTYSKIHEQGRDYCKLENNPEHEPVNFGFLKSSDFHVSNPESLASFIDESFKEIRSPHCGRECFL